MSASAGRKAKVEQALRDTLAELIAREVKDPRVRAGGLLSVTRVECNVDLSVANVYVSLYGGKPGGDVAIDEAVRGLQRAAGFLRGPTGRALNLRHPPELRFLRDQSAQVGLDLAAIIREDEEKARAVGRVPGEAPKDPDDSTSEREPTKVLDEEPTADLHPAALAADDDPAVDEPDEHDEPEPEPGEDAP